jgi:trans-aconitate methyltransferase
MNRERVCIGSNSYTKDLSLNPVDFLRKRLETCRDGSWLDLCCGRGRALIQAGEILASEGAHNRVALAGVDLIPMFDSHSIESGRLRFIEASAFDWQPEQQFDLITCVHGLHYIGDKLGLIARACGWLKSDGFFIAKLDDENLKLVDGASHRALLQTVRGAGLKYNRRSHRISCQGRKQITFPYQYVGADDRAGPNYTKQPAVDSYYRRLA